MDFDSSGSSPIDSLGDLDQGDSELRNFLAFEQQRVAFQAQINKLHDVCWDKCMDGKPGVKLDSRTEVCFTNCVDRFIDVSLAIASRFANALQRQAGGM
ncbi:unnamed protein product [Notodromas monacha]|uniref:Mitochondrial import inner membrane translocase subunit n=1 Tax=Notodromas monacha TaxID=399045 RepID=A0A7R9BKG9_9CRUS|nr:unnamed protein product [Notodromas monacha]CAG0916369.1 unnamed protein product [Notodromas monacha]